MGPSSGIGFAAKVLQEVLQDDQPADPDFYYLFSLDDFQRSKALDESDSLLWEINPTELPPRQTADKVSKSCLPRETSTNSNNQKLIKDYFIFTERIFPVLHQPSFLNVVDDLYKKNIGLESFEYLAQFYFAISIAYWFDTSLSLQEKTRYQIRALQTGCR